MVKEISYFQILDKTFPAAKSILTEENRTVFLNQGSRKPLGSSDILIRIYKNVNNSIGAQQWDNIQTFLFKMLALFRGASFWPPPMVYISVICCTLHNKLQFFMLDLCGQLSCTASTLVFPTCGYSSCCWTSALFSHICHQFL